MQTQPNEQSVTEPRVAGGLDRYEKIVRSLAALLSNQIARYTRGETLRCYMDAEEFVEQSLPELVGEGGAAEQSGAPELEPRQVVRSSEWLCEVPPATPDSAAAPGSGPLELEPRAESGESSGLVGAGGEPRLVITSTPLDLELCTLLGDKPSDFVILLADGKTVPGYGTPYDSPTARKNCTYICSRLNEDGKDSWWPEFAKNWGNRLAEICPPETRPVFSWELHRVCAGHSAYLHCAIRLFEKLADRISSWGVGVMDGLGNAGLEMNGKYYTEQDPDLALAIGRAVARALREVGGGGAELVTKDSQRHEGKALNAEVQRQARAGGAR